MSKDLAEAEAIRRWYGLPQRQRETFEHAYEFAAQLEPALDFRSLCNKRKLIAAWLIREMGRTRGLYEFKKAA